MVVLEKIEVVVEEGEVRAFYSNKGAKAFQKHLAKKGFLEERRFKQLVPPLRRKSTDEAGRRWASIGN